MSKRSSEALASGMLSYANAAAAHHLGSCAVQSQRVTAPRAAPLQVASEWRALATAQRDMMRANEELQAIMERASPPPGLLSAALGTSPPQRAPNPIVHTDAFARRAELPVGSPASSLERALSHMLRGEIACGSPSPLAPALQSPVQQRASAPRPVQRPPGSGPRRSHFAPSSPMDIAA